MPVDDRQNDESENKLENLIPTFVVSSDLTLRIKIIYMGKTIEMDGMRNMEKCPKIGEKHHYFAIKYIKLSHDIYVYSHTHVHTSTHDATVHTTVHTTVTRDATVLIDAYRLYVTIIIDHHYQCTQSTHVP